MTSLDKCKLKAKASKRNARYFKETFVLNYYSNKYVRGRYSHSFHCLYGKSWLDGKPRGELQQEFYDDLITYFSKDKIRLVQTQAMNYLDKYGINPSMPDVWLINNRGKSWFVEVKKYDEEIIEGQIEGLALIKRFLKSRISIIRLYPEKSLHARNTLQDYDGEKKKKFEKIYNSLKGKKGGESKKAINKTL